MSFQGALATSVATAALIAAVLAPSAMATTDRADYAAQANAICKSANAQQDQFFTTLEQTTNALERRRNRLDGKKRRKLDRRLEAIYRQAPYQYLAIGQAELTQLKAIAPAAGDESIVSEWLGHRELQQAIFLQSLALEQKIEKVFSGSGNVTVIRPNTRKKVNRRLKRQRREFRRLAQQEKALYEQYEASRKIDLELGTQLGATYCVTGATGVVIGTIG